MSTPAQQRTSTHGSIPSESHTRKATDYPPNEDLCCIYVHAGAGYHSHQNEQIHLEACNDAAQLAMLILKNGGSALDAVEIAVKTLEDREITNAGYGSNLAMDGVVECDAAIVDHHGRSGAVGAVAQIKNPISLARLVHSHAMQSLTLRRVPPNLLVGQGATDFAVEMDMPILPHDALVSPAAKERWLRWRSDLRAAERKGKRSGNHPSCWKVRADTTPKEAQNQQIMREQHTQNLLRGQSVRDQSPSSLPSDELPCYFDDEITPTEELLPHSRKTSGSWHNENNVATPATSDPTLAPEPVPLQTIKESSRNAFINSTQKVPTISQYKADRPSRDAGSDTLSGDTDMEDMCDDVSHITPRRGRKPGGDGQADFAPGVETIHAVPLQPLDVSERTSIPAIKTEDKISTSSARSAIRSSQTEEMVPHSQAQPAQSHQQEEDEEDLITDTVGAIAIDSSGNIACGASSGGIGMKYRGRVGPAALVGVGAAIIPAGPDDPEEACVATVASGTGEHMATTMAAAVCAERLYQSVMKGKDGEYVEVSEDEAVRAMIENDFMAHPSVRHSNSAGAIGVLGIKKLASGTLLYFGHNTDSFAMASMTFSDTVPKCTMSRSKGNGQIAQGGRVISYGRNKRAKSTQRYR